jgi:transposase
VTEAADVPREEVHHDLAPPTLTTRPEVTGAAVQAAFPKGNLCVALRAEFGTLYEDQLFADLYPPQGRPVEVAP